MTKILFIVSMFFFIACATNFAQDMNPEAGKLYNEGNSQLNAGNYNGAIDNYKKALAIEKDYRIYYQLGLAEKKAGKLEEAKNSLETCLQLKSSFEAGHNALGGVFFSMGNYQAAIDNFQKVLNESNNGQTKAKVKKNISLAYAKLGSVAVTNGDPTKAIEMYKKSVENNNYDAAYLSLAKLYSELGEYDKSIAAAENALKYRNSISSGGAYFYMGISYKGKGDITKAKEMLNKAKSDATYKKTAEYELGTLN